MKHYRSIILCALAIGALFAACSASRTGADTGPAPDSSGSDVVPVLDALADLDAPSDVARDAADASVLDAADVATANDAADVAAPDACMLGATSLPPADPSCPAGSWSCGGRCTNLNSDPYNCGACGVRCCAPWCINGRCGAEGPPGHTACALPCTPLCAGNFIVVDLNTDPANCGACSHPCNAGQVCNTGLCADP